ncbi:MAG: type II toxin-antitoxin system PemK/MazF family toxin [Clostridiales Family XIII bacterium]|jgi:mRNA interferase MazF|nr:type II toxin-antitoxin system PemK/MazF family toxin [Clostridiales Family XIII bacterium]
MGYSAKQGDIVWINLNPKVGHEQAGRRPAVVVTNDYTHGLINKRAMLCPVTNRNKGFPFQPSLDNRTQTQGVILCDQTRIVDVDARNAVYIERLPDDILDEVIDIIYGMIERV